MDALITLLFLAGITALFVVMVRRSNAKARELEVMQGHRPELLSKEQRKRLNLKQRQPEKKTSKAPKPVQPKEPLKPTRAIRQGWSIAEVAFTYEDSVGDVSYRTVTAHSVTAVYLKGECHGRRAERTFRIDRIIGDMTDCETGEVLSPKEWVRRYV